MKVRQTREVNAVLRHVVFVGNRKEALHDFAPATRNAMFSVCDIAQFREDSQIVYHVSRGMSVCSTFFVGRAIS